MPIHFHGLLILIFLSSCNLIGMSTSNNANEGGDNVDIGMSDGTSAGLECSDGLECESGVCDAGQCISSKCFDRLKNGEETDLDCGGLCAPCTTGMGCAENSDCDGGACTNKVCKPDSCVDELKNGNESDFDCGGDCPPCLPNGSCVTDSDCESQICTDKICLSALCGDSVINGEEECDEGGVDTITCNADCTSALCGDGVLNMAANETCDDGNVITEACVYGELACSVCDDACTVQAGAITFCGDGNVDPNEVCDDATNDGSPGSCLNDCSAPVVCGDGNVSGTEDCDDGNTDTEDCSYGATNCTICDATCANVAGETSYCGDGATDIGNSEQCDDGNLIDNDVCKNNCQLASRRVFVTSQTTQGNFGGLAGGDAYCQTLADAAGLGGVYMAWISDSTGSPSTRFTQSIIPYRLVDGTLIADDWADLIDGSLESPIELTELGGIPPDANTACGGTIPGHAAVWSNTSREGTERSALSSCTDWSTLSGSSRWGRWNITDNSWSDWCSGGNCSWVANLYCFEQ